MNRNKILFISILIISLIGLATIFVLVFEQIAYGNICPPILGAPACYIILVFILLISHLKIIEDKNILFFSSAGICWLIAIYASYSQINGLLECPKCLVEIPLCYLSLIMFSILIILKLFEIKPKYFNFHILLFTLSKVSPAAP